jgi:hypothetical protein
MICVEPSCFDRTFPQIQGILRLNFISSCVISIIEASKMNPGEALMIIILRKIRPVYDRRFRFTSHNLKFHTSHHTIPDGVKFIVPITSMRLKNARLAISRRISQLGYQDRVKTLIRWRKPILKRISSCAIITQLSVHLIRTWVLGSRGTHPIIPTLSFSRMISVYDSHPTCDPGIRHFSGREWFGEIVQIVS